MRLWRKHPDSFSAGLLPPGLVAGMIAGLPISVLFPHFALAYAGALIAYAAVVLCGSLTTALREKRLRLLPWLPITFVTIHVASGTGLLLELLQYRRRGAASKTQCTSLS